MTTRTIITRTLIASLAALGLTGCPGVEGPDPIINDWESTDVIGVERNDLAIDDDLEGDATIYFYMDGYLYYADFKVEAEAKGDGEYELSMECVGDCGFLDFEMECELGGDGDELDCEGSDLWSEYEFNWQAR